MRPSRRGFDATQRDTLRCGPVGRGGVAGGAIPREACHDVSSLRTTTIFLTHAPRPLNARRIRNTLQPLSTDSMASSNSESEPHDFMHEELVRALSEQSFGISKYEVISSSPLKATANVALLESDIVTVSLTGRGFQVCSG